MNNNYIIAVDESGQPYIAHAFGDSPGYGREKKNHKYIVRIRNGLKWRYFYTLDEYEAYMRALRESDSKKYKKAKDRVQENPHAESVFSEEELQKIDYVSDRKVNTAKIRYQIAQKRYNKARSSGNYSPNDLQRYKNELEKAQREYELMKDIM